MLTKWIKEHLHKSTAPAERPHPEHANDGDQSAEKHARFAGSPLPQLAGLVDWGGRPLNMLLDTITKGEGRGGDVDRTPSSYHVGRGSCVGINGGDMLWRKMYWVFALF